MGRLKVPDVYVLGIFYILIEEKTRIKCHIRNKEIENTQPFTTANALQA